MEKFFVSKNFRGPGGYAHELLAFLPFLPFMEVSLLCTVSSRRYGWLMKTKNPLIRWVFCSLLFCYAISTCNSIFWYMQYILEFTKYTWI